MDFDEYMEWTDKTATYPSSGKGRIEAINYVTFGIGGESGEVLEKVKKLHRDKGGVMDAEWKDGMKKELGDVLYYVARMCKELDIPMSEVVISNVEKLESRKARGVIGGSGDDR